MLFLFDQIGDDPLKLNMDFLIVAKAGRHGKRPNMFWEFRQMEFDSLSDNFEIFLGVRNFLEGFILHSDFGNR